MFPSNLWQYVRIEIDELVKISRNETLEGMTDKHELEVFKSLLLGGGRQTAKQIDITVDLT